MNLVLKAVRYMNQKHEGQVRKKSGLPYASHPLAVSYIVAAHKQSKHLENLLAAALLHDVLEDTDAIEAELAAEFSPMVASLVVELTNDPKAIAQLGKAKYQQEKMLKMTSYGLLLKLADRYDNITDSPSPSMVVDTLELVAVLRAGRRLSRTHIDLLNAIELECLHITKKE